MRLQIEQQQKIKRDYSRKVLQAILEEIEIGINRCLTIVKFSEEGKGSYSRIYTSLWDSAKIIISEGIEDIEVLRLLHKIYHRFDLINFNMEKERLGPGAAFAREYGREITENYASLKERIRGSEVDNYSSA